MSTDADTEPERTGVLADLDNQVTTSFYWYLAVLSCIGGFLFGYDTADIGSGLAFVPYHLSDFATGYLGAGASIGAAGGALGAAPPSGRVGRKNLPVRRAAVYAIGALLEGLAWERGGLLFARPP